jgi:Ca2+-binding RTX toxin-like protein
MREERMSKVQYTELMPEYSGMLDIVSNKPETLDKKSTHSATYTDPQSGGHIVFEGENFKYHGDLITKGTVESIHFTDADGNDLVVASKLPADAADLSKALVNKNVLSMLELMFDGKDKWIGSDNNDYIFGDKGNDKLVGGLGDDELAGGAGRDKLIGGKGSDYFDIYTGEGKDTVIDFHADGGAGVQDYIGVYNDHYKIKDAGDDTIIDLGKGDVLVLKGVDSADITTDDFYVYS